MAFEPSFGNLAVDRDALPPIPADASFRIALLGDFSGRANRGLLDAGADLAARKPLVVNPQDLDAAFAKLKPKLVLPIVAGATKVELEFSSTDDLYPERLLKELDVLLDLKDAKDEVDSSRFDDLAETWKEWGEAGNEPLHAPLDKSRAAAVPQVESLSELAALEGKGTASEAGDAKGAELVERALGPRIPSGDPDQEAYVKAVDAAIHDVLREATHHPDFQSLEANWQGLDWLIRRCVKGKIEFVVHDVSAQEFAADLAQHDELGDSGLYRLLGEKGAHAPHGQPWALIVGLYEFVPCPAHANLLGRMAKLAELFKAPFLAATASDVSNEGYKPEDDAADAWTALRGEPEAGWIGLAAPRFLVRLPYGENFKPFEDYPYEEFSPQEGRSGFLWAPACLAIAASLGQAFVDTKWKFKPGAAAELAGSPVFAYHDEEQDERVSVSVEKVFTGKIGQNMVKYGFMPILTVRGRDSIEVGKVLSLAEKPIELLGRWEPPEGGLPKPRASKSTMNLMGGPIEGGVSSDYSEGQVYSGDESSSYRSSGGGGGQTYSTPSRSASVPDDADDGLAALMASNEESSGSSDDDSSSSDDDSFGSSDSDSSSSDDDPFGSSSDTSSSSDDDPFASSSSDDDPFASTSTDDDPFATPSTEDDPFASVETPETPAEDDPFASVETPETPAEDDPFASIETPTEEDPFASVETPETPAEDDPFASVATPETPAEEDPFASVGSSGGDEEDPFAGIDSGLSADDPFAGISDTEDKSPAESSSDDADDERSPMSDSGADDLDPEAMELQAKLDEEPYEPFAGGSPTILPFKDLIQPISEDAPAGDPVPFAMREKLEEARKEVDPSQFAEDDPLRPEDPKYADWPTIELLTQELLKERSKDLLLSARLTEALAKQYGFAGLRDGLHLMRLLAMVCWNRVYPEIEDPDEDLETRAAPFNWLDDPDRGARFPTSVRMIPLLTFQGKNLSALDWKLAQEGKGKITAENFDQAVRAASYESLHKTFLDAEAAVTETTKLLTFLDGKLGSSSPSLSKLKQALGESRTLLDQVVKKKGPSEAEQAATAAAAAGGAGNGSAMTTAGGMGTAVGMMDPGMGGPAMVMQPRGMTREDIYRHLQQLADLLQKAEPHSPVPYLINKAVNFGSLPFPLLMRALIRDMAVITEMNRELGIKEPVEGEAADGTAAAAEADPNNPWAGWK